jgi:hypothetical protein
LIDGIVATGRLVFVVGASQGGKTLFMLNIVWRLLVGGKLFGQFAINPVEKVLYLALEDPPGRIKARLCDMLSEFGTLPRKNHLIFEFLHDLKLHVDIEYLEDLVQEHRPDVLVIDTYQKATGGLSSFDDEKQGPILHALVNLARAQKLNIFVLDHTRDNKAGGLSLRDIKGTGGKAQNADTVIFLEKKAGNKVRVRSLSKDYADEVDFYLKVSPQGSQEPKFTWIGKRSSTIKPRTKSGTVQTQIDSVLDAVKAQWTTRKEIQTKTGISETTLRRILRKLVALGLIERRGKTKSTIYRRKK